MNTTKFRYDDPELLDFFGPMYQEMLGQLVSGRAPFLNAPPEAPCTAGDMMGWLAMSAMAYGYRRGQKEARK